MLRLALLIAAVQAPADTLFLPVTTAFRQAMEVSRDVSMAQRRSESSLDQAAQAGALPNPTLTVSAENLGRAREITGLAAPDGIEGQAILAANLPWGPTRSGTVGAARARADAGEARLRLVRFETAEGVLGAMATLVRDQAVAENARFEVQTLDRLAESLSRQAEEGRAATSDAARAQLARGLAATGLARKEVALAVAAAEMGRHLGADPEQWVRLEIRACTAESRAVPSDVDARAPEVDWASARLDEARWSVSLARGLGAPDFQPHVGLRRGAGYSALYLGFSATIPFFDRGSRGVAAARGEQEAAATDLSDVEARLAAEVVAARRGLEALDRAGGVFSSDWFQALERAVTAAEARYEVGEGTLFELLDNRRARLQALDDYATWQAEWWQARARVARLLGHMPDASLLCTDPFREND